MSDTAKIRCKNEDCGWRGDFSEVSFGGGELSCPECSGVELEDLTFKTNGDNK